jgi:hypothetical protein
MVKVDVLVGELEAQQKRFAHLPCCVPEMLGLRAVFDIRNQRAGGGETHTTACAT